jgi:O-antigen ligase
MYLVFSIAILSRYIFLEYKTISPLKATLSALLMAYFFVVVFLLSSKAGIMGLGLIIFMQMVMVFSRRTLLKPGILIAMISMLLFYLCFTMFSYTSSRFVKMQQAVAGDTGEMGNTRDGSSERIAVWRSAVEIIREHPFIGVGTGDVKDQLMNTYSRNNYMVTLKQKLNAHDQYLQTFIALGLPGILTLLAMLAIPGYMAIRRKSFLYRSFLALFAFNILFESMLETQAGVVFYAFFNTFFFWILVNNMMDQD